MTNTQQAAMRVAIDAFQSTNIERHVAAIGALRAALAEPEPEPAQQNPAATFDEVFDAIDWDMWRMQPIRELVRMIHSKTVPPPSEPADWHQFPKSNTGVAADAIDAVLSERNYPASPAAAARCGWEAAHRLLKALLAESAAEVPLLTVEEILNIAKQVGIDGYDERTSFAQAIEKAVRQKAGIK